MQAKASRRGVPEAVSNCRSLIDQSTIKNYANLFDPDLPSIPMLTFLSGEAVGRELPVLKRQITIGRGEEADVLIMDPSVSRKHARLSCRKVLASGGSRRVHVIVQDLGSKNGTLVNYRPVRRAVLKPGDKISVGRIILRFEYRDLADQNFYDEIYRLATTDSLTGLLNKAAITRVLTDEIVKRDRYRGCLSVALLDVDDFKDLNDTQGHLAGDRALQLIGDVLRGNLRRQDRAGRFGGDEFLLVLPETGLEGALTLSDRVRRDLQKALSAGARSAPVTVSIGVAALTRAGNGGGQLLELADQAVYQAKANGKNRVACFRREFTPEGRN